MFGAAGSALASIVSPTYLLMIVLGMLLGLTLGALPGLGGLNGIAILLPFVFHMEPSLGIALLVSIIAVQSTGDTLSSVLLGIPGTAASQATVMDGYPLARQGHAIQALTAAFVASAVGGVFGALVLFLIIPVAGPIVLALGTPHLFMLTVLGITTVAVLSGSQPLKGLTTGFLGLLIATIGYTPDRVLTRFTFGFEYLWDGIPLVVFVLGLFGLPEVISILIRGTQIAESQKLGRGFGQGLRDYRANWLLSLRTSVLGVFVGLIPGLGGAVVDWLAYGHTVQSTRDKTRFGKGEIRGVIGPESANNAKEGGAFIPTILFGIPGSGTMALFLAALAVLGVSPGRAMVTTHEGLTLTYTIVWSLAIANVLATGVMLVFVKPFARVTTLNTYYLAPVVLVLITVAGYQASNHWGDFITMLVIGIFAWFMKQYGWPRPPLLVGYVLGTLAERYLSISVIRYGAGWLLDVGVLLILAFTIASALGGFFYNRKIFGPTKPSKGDPGKPT
jgi:TctA family transporter